MQILQQTTTRARALAPAPGSRFRRIDTAVSAFPRAVWDVVVEGFATWGQSYCGSPLRSDIAVHGKNDSAASPSPLARHPRLGPPVNANLAGAAGSFDREVSDTDNETGRLRGDGGARLARREACQA
jgi:hypothetical protein